MSAHSQTGPSPLDAVLSWKISSRCNNGSCVAVAALPGGHVAMRDTKAADSPILSFSGEEWAAFVGLIKQG